MQKPLAWLISAARSAKSRRMYGMIGGKSPILEITTAQANALEKASQSEIFQSDSLQKGEQAKLFGGRVSHTASRYMSGCATGIPSSAIQ